MRCGSGPHVPVKTMTGRVVGEVSDVDLGDDASFFVLLEVKDMSMFLCFQDPKIYEQLEIRVKERTHPQ